MIEKKISYNEPKPTKVPSIKPVKQGGRLNYLGKQKTVTAPVKWKSGPTHPITHLAYITDEEQKVLVKLNMYKSMNGKPNKGPFGLPSLNDGDGSGGGGSGSDGAGAGDSGGSGGGASASGGGGDDGAGASAAGDAGGATGDSGGVGGSGDSGAGGVGQGPGGEEGTSGVSAAQAAAQSVTADNVSMQAQADMEDAATAAAANAANQTGIAGLATKALQAYMAFSPTVAIAKAIANTISNISKGVTAPDDFSQMDTSVQTSTPGPNNSGGITTIEQYAPLTNISSGDNTGDALVTRLNAALKTQPNIYGIPSVSPYSNYTLLDLYNNRYI
jgi:hypothetical protein